MQMIGRVIVLGLVLVMTAALPGAAKVPGSVRAVDFGAMGDGVTDDTAAIQSPERGGVFAVGRTEDAARDHAAGRGRTVGELSYASHRAEEGVLRRQTRARLQRQGICDLLPQ